MILRQALLKWVTGLPSGTLSHTFSNLRMQWKRLLEHQPQPYFPQPLQNLLKLMVVSLKKTSDSFRKSTISFVNPRKYQGAFLV